MTPIDLTVLLVYFALMIGIGWWASRRIHNQEDYFMGGRGFGKWLQTFAAFGAGTGAHEPVTVGRTGWTSGLSGVWSAMMWLFVTPIYWITAVWYRRMRHLTLGDWFVERYQSKALGAAYALFAIVFYMFYLSTMLSAVAKFSVPLMDTESLWGLPAAQVLIPGICVVVITYGVLGGLTAAYWTDLIQGAFIILLSVLLIPCGLWQLSERFGDGSAPTLSEGFRVLHQRVAPEFFELFSGPASGEFPVHYIISLTLLSLIGIVVQPHFIATGGGSAKTENEARIGLVAGNFLKRLCTVGWAMTALIALALLAGQAEIAGDPDRVWGVAAREILGPLNLGLVGLMLACLLAAMMSSADTYMLVTSALVVRNVYVALIDPSADEKKCVRLGRATGVVIVVGAGAVAMTLSDVFGQFKLAIELPILFAAPFWIGMYWRRTGKWAVWGTVAFSAIVFFVLPLLLPVVMPGLRSHPALAAATQRVTTTTTRPATESDVARREAWQEAESEIRDSDLPADVKRQRMTDLGTPPPQGELGQPIDVVRVTGGQSVYWSGGLEDGAEIEWEAIDRSSTERQQRVVHRRVGPATGLGRLNLDLGLYAAAGMDLSQASGATLATLRLPGRVLLPFGVLIVLSLITPRPDARATDAYFVKMNTPVQADPVADRQRLRHLEQHPAECQPRKLFPHSDWEFVVPSRADVVGFGVSILICGVIIALMIWLAGIGGQG